VAAGPSTKPLDDTSDKPLHIKSKNELIKKFVRFLNAADLDSSSGAVELLTAFCDSQKGKSKKALPTKHLSDGESSTYHSAVEDFSAADTDFELEDPPTPTYKESYLTSFELELDSQTVDQEPIS